MTGGGGTWRGVINVPPPLVPPTDVEEGNQARSHLPVAVSSKRSAPLPTAHGAPYRSPLKRSCVRQLSGQASGTAIALSPGLPNITPAGTAVLKEEEDKAKEEGEDKLVCQGPSPRTLQQDHVAPAKQRERSRLLRWGRIVGGRQFFRCFSQKLTFDLLLWLSPILAPTGPAVRALPPLTQAIMLSSSEKREIGSTDLKGSIKAGSSRGQKFAAGHGRGESAYGLYGRAKTNDSSLSAPLLMFGQVGRGRSCARGSLIQHLLPSPS